MQQCIRSCSRALYCTTACSPPRFNNRIVTRVLLLQSGPSAGSHTETIGSLDLSKLPAVSFAAMRLEIGSWQVILQAYFMAFAPCPEMQFCICMQCQPQTVCLLCCKAARHSPLISRCILTLNFLAVHCKHQGRSFCYLLLCPAPAVMASC